MSIELTAAQAATLAMLAAEQDRPLRLHQVVGAGDLLVATGRSEEPDLRIDPTGTSERLEAGDQM